MRRYRSVSGFDFGPELGLFGNNSNPPLPPPGDPFPPTDGSSWWGPQDPNDPVLQEPISFRPPKKHFNFPDEGINLADDPHVRANSGLIGLNPNFSKPCTTYFIHISPDLSQGFFVTNSTLTALSLSFRVRGIVIDGKTGEIRTMFTQIPEISPDFLNSPREWEGYSGPYVVFIGSANDTAVKEIQPGDGVKWQLGFLNNLSFEDINLPLSPEQDTYFSTYWDPPVQHDGIPYKICFRMSLDQRGCLHIYIEESDSMGGCFQY